MAAHSIVAIVFLQLAAGVHAKRMTRADFLIERIQNRAPLVGAAMETLFLLLGAAVMVMIAYSGWRPMMGAFAAREFFGVQGLFTVPTWPFRAVIVFGASLAALVFVAQAMAEARKLRQG
jgi:TRAP-type mannitol/chloroaromatic compound transport system permease small subunit